MFTITNKIDEMPTTTKKTKKSDEYEIAFDSLKNEGDSFFAKGVKMGTVSTHFHNYCKEGFALNRTKSLYAIKDTVENGEEGVRFYLVKHPRDVEPETSNQRDTENNSIVQTQ